VQRTAEERLSSAPDTPPRKWFVRVVDRKIGHSLCRGSGMVGKRCAAQKPVTTFALFGLRAWKIAMRENSPAERILRRRAIFHIYKSAGTVA
jgi:hypothetical protein